jgi:hypothetical protein
LNDIIPYRLNNHCIVGAILLYELPVNLFRKTLMMRLNTLATTNVLNLIIKLYNFKSITNAIQRLCQQELKIDDFQCFYKALTIKGLQYS